jgi:hypothetical protein
LVSLQMLVSLLLLASLLMLASLLVGGLTAVAVFPDVAVVLTYFLLSLRIQIILGLSCAYYRTLIIGLQKFYALGISIIVDDRTGKYKKLFDHRLSDWCLNHRTNGYRTDIIYRPPLQTLFAEPILSLLRMYLHDGKYFEAPIDIQRFSRTLNRLCIYTVIRRPINFYSVLQ